MTAASSDRDSIVLRFLALMSDAGEDGAVSAGRVLEWIDRAGFACATRWSDSACVTAYVGDVRFSRPIRSGELIEVTASIVHTGSSGMNVLLTVAAGDPRGVDLSVRASCIAVFVAVGSHGPVSIPVWSPRSLPQLERHNSIDERVTARQRLRELMDSAQYTDAGTAPRLTLTFLAASSDANFGGSVQGGAVMRWMDETANTCATQWAGDRTLSVYAGGIHFARPIHVGDLVEIEARLLLTTARSAHVSIRVRSGDPRKLVLHPTTSCLSVVVVVGSGGRAEPMRAFDPISDEDRALDALARRLQAERAALAPIIAPEGEAAEAPLSGLLELGDYRQLH